MNDTKDKFRNVILCEDIRDEVGAKRSLMGVFGGDIVVQSLPAQIQIAAYIEYIPDVSNGERVTFDIRMMRDDTEMMKAHAVAPMEHGKPATLILPRGLATFEKNCTLRLLIAVNGGAEIEILSKRIQQGPIS
ncbi:MAG TPA: hypothetical protein VFO15_02615 [Xanthobacteraceae bacterium]|nr:hypothetical protein [Xanthobacteraceae bacterium]